MRVAAAGRWGRQLGVAKGKPTNRLDKQTRKKKQEMSSKATDGNRVGGEGVVERHKKERCVKEEGGSVSESGREDDGGRRAGGVGGAA